MAKTIKPKIPKSVIIAAIIAVTVLEIVALLKGMNGHILALAIATIAGLAGWVCPQLKLK